jgi:hypothetical protein
MTFLLMGKLSCLKRKETRKEKGKKRGKKDKDGYPTQIYWFQLLMMRLPKKVNQAIRAQKKRNSVQFVLEIMIQTTAPDREWIGTIFMIIKGTGLLRRLGSTTKGITTTITGR